MRFIPKAFADASTGDIGDFTPKGPGVISGDTELSDTLTSAANFLIPIVISFAVIAIIVGGIMWALAAGDEEKIAKAKLTIKLAIIGLIVLLLSFVIVRYVAGIFAPDLNQYS